jgi:hypothetical protein
MEIIFNKYTQRNGEI